MEADVHIAEAELGLGNGPGAIHVLAPYLKDALEDPDANDDVLLRHARGLVLSDKLKEARKLLQPLTRDSDKWRDAAISLIVLGKTEAKTASSWLQQLEQQVPPANMPQRIRLARSWWMIGTQVGTHGARENARRIIDQVTAHPDATGNAWFFRGLVAETSNQLDTAIASYRRALQLDSKNPAVKNNLAMALAKRGPTYEEAVALARAAVDTEPDDPNFRDTLAFVQSKAGSYEQAIATMKIAIKLEPRNPKWKRHLARILADAGRTEEADQLMRELQGTGMQMQ